MGPEPKQATPKLPQFLKLKKQPHVFAMVKKLTIQISADISPTKEECYQNIKNTMPHHISDQLNLLMTERKTKASALALGTGISHATLSKIRQENYTGTPSFEVIQKICDFFDVPLETFARKSTIRIPYIQMKFHDYALNEGAKIYAKYMEKCINKETIYISDTIPDALKTEAIFKAELGNKNYIKNYAKFMKSIRENDSMINNLVGSFFIDVRTISEIINRQGKYEILSREETQEQIDILKAFFSKAFPRVHGYVLNYKENDLSTAFVIEKKFGAQFAYGGYLEWESEQLGTIIHNKAVASINNAESISSFLKKL